MVLSALLLFSLACAAPGSESHRVRGEIGVGDVTHVVSTLAPLGKDAGTGEDLDADMPLVVGHEALVGWTLVESISWGRMRSGGVLR